MALCVRFLCALAFTVSPKMSSGDPSAFEDDAPQDAVMRRKGAHFLMSVNEPTFSEILASLEPQKYTALPSANRLRGLKPLREYQSCKVYRNGYAVYENELGSTVLWFPACSTFTYHFARSSSKETHMPAFETLDEEKMSVFPWYIAVALHGEYRIESNNMNRHGDRRGVAVKYEEAEQAAKPTMSRWYVARIPGPETLVIQQDTIRTFLATLSERQKEIFLLYYLDGYTLSEIASKIGVSSQRISMILQSLRRSKIEKFE